MYYLGYLRSDKSKLRPASYNRPDLAGKRLPSMVENISCHIINEVDTTVGFETDWEVL